jgi:hypothetical protein
MSENTHRLIHQIRQLLTDANVTHIEATGVLETIKFSVLVGTYRDKARRGDETMNIYEIAGLNKGGVAKMKATIAEIIKENASLETVVSRGTEQCDRDSFVIGLLIGMEVRVIDDGLIGFS